MYICLFIFVDVHVSVCVCVPQCICSCVLAGEHKYGLGEGGNMLFWHGRI